MKMVILVDSGSTARPDVYKGKDVKMIPLHITKEDGTDLLDTKENTDKIKLLKQIEDGQDWKTSQASPGELEDKYVELLKKYDHIIHLPITANLSSMMQTSLMVAKDELFEGKVTVIQNERIAAQGIQEMALHLESLIKSKKLKTPEEVVKEFNRWSDFVYTAIIPGDLKKLSRGGRATGVISTVLNIFKTKLLIVWDKDPKKEGIGRTVGSLTEKVINHLKESPEYKKGYKFTFMHTPLTTEKAIKAVEEELNKAKIKYEIELVPNLYTVHAGVQTIGFNIVPSN